MDAAELSEPELWSRYYTYCDTRARELLFAYHLPWAALIGRHVYSKIRTYEIDRDDFVQNAIIGLLEAMSKYDPNRGIAFRAYALPRVRGAVFDGIRLVLGARHVSFEGCQLADWAETEREFGAKDSYDNLIDSVLSVGNSNFVNTPTAKHDECFAGAFSRQLQGKLSTAIDKLPDRLKMIIHAHYFQHVPFHEMAKRLTLTKGRISQLHSVALMKLRFQLGHREDW